MSGFINIFLLTKNQKARFTHIFVILVKSPMEVLRIKHLLFTVYLIRIPYQMVREKCLYCMILYEFNSQKNTQPQQERRISLITVKQPHAY